MQILFQHIEVAVLPEAGTKSSKAMNVRYRIIHQDQSTSHSLRAKCYIYIKVICEWMSWFAATYRKFFETKRKEDDVYPNSTSTPILCLSESDRHHWVELSFPHCLVNQILFHFQSVKQGNVVFHLCLRSCCKSFLWHKKIIVSILQFKNMGKI